MGGWTATNCTICKFFLHNFYSLVRSGPNGWTDSRKMDGHLKRKICAEIQPSRAASDFHVFAFALVKVAVARCFASLLALPQSTESASVALPSFVPSQIAFAPTAIWESPWQKAAEYLYQQSPLKLKPLQTNQCFLHRKESLFFFAQDTVSKCTGVSDSRRSITMTPSQLVILHRWAIFPKYISCLHSLHRPQKLALNPRRNLRERNPPPYNDVARGLNLIVPSQ